MAQTIQLRRGTGTQWTTANPILAVGEIGLELDTSLHKIGDGSTAWNDLEYRELSPTLGVSTYDSQDDAPSAPSAGKLHMYASDHSGRILPRIKGPSGLDTALQPGLFGNGIYIVAPGVTTAMSALGGPAPTVVGTVSHPILSSTSLRQQTSRANVLSAATAASSAELRSTQLRVWRGDAVGLGGFFCRFRFSIISTTALQRTFVGLTNSIAAIVTTQDPVALTNVLGVGNASTDTNLQMLCNDGAGTCTKVDLGSSFPAQGVDDIYDLTMFAAPFSSSIEWKMERFNTPAIAEGTWTTDIPATSQFLAPRIYMNNGGTAASVNFDLVRWYIETDY